MIVIQRYTIPLLLLISFLLLSSLVPGGPIENRDFSHINSMVLLGFNIFLTLLALGSLPFAYAAWLRARWAYAGAVVAGVAYFVIYGLDLAGLFPQSPTPMSMALFLVELAGLVVALPLVFYGYHALRNIQNDLSAEVSIWSNRFVWLGGGAVAILIVWFATWSAIYSGG